MACSSEDNAPSQGASSGGTANSSGGVGGLTSSGGTTNGGNNATAGGTSGAGGAPSSNGGSFASGGSYASGGATTSSGGMSSTGGATATGGSNPGTGGAASGGVAGSGGGTAGGTLPPVTDVGKAGPYAVTTDPSAGANSTVWRPTDLGKDGVKHPIFVWGTGSTALPSRYNDHFTHVASHGFVVVSPNSSSVNASLLKASLDWILAQDAASGPYQGKLATNKVAMGGHSLGSVGTFNVEATETRLTTTIHIAGGSFDGQGSAKVKTPTAYICGAAGDIALPQCKVDFENAKAGNPTFYSELQGIGHVEAARSALPGITAWLRWHLAGETERKAMFTPPSGQFTQGIWKSQVKNW